MSEQQVSKPWWKSKTIWVNLAAVSAAVLTEVQGWDVMPEGWEGITAAILGVLNLGLRSVSSKKITVRQKEDV